MRVVLPGLKKKFLEKKTLSSNFQKLYVIILLLLKQMSSDGFSDYSRLRMGRGFSPKVKGLNMVLKNAVVKTPVEVATVLYCT